LIIESVVVTTEITETKIEDQAEEVVAEVAGGIMELVEITNAVVADVCIYCTFVLFLCC